MADGAFCAIPQEVLVAMLRHRFSEREHSVLLAIAYRQYRFHADDGKAQPIGFGGFRSLTGLDRHTVVRAINSLAERRIISVQRGGRAQRNSYTINPPGWWLQRHYPRREPASLGSGSRATTDGGSRATGTSGAGATTDNQQTRNNQHGSSGLRPSERAAPAPLSAFEKAQKDVERIFVNESNGAVA